MLRGEHDELTATLAKHKADKHLKGLCWVTIEPILQAHNMKRQTIMVGRLWATTSMHEGIDAAFILQAVNGPLGIITERCPEMLQTPTS